MADFRYYRVVIGYLHMAPSVNKSPHSLFSAIVEHHQSVEGAAVSRPCSTPHSHNRRIKDWMGWSPPAPHSTGPMGCQAPISPHQLPKALSCSPSIESFPTSPSSQGCPGQEEQYGSHVLYSKLGGTWSIQL